METVFKNPAKAQPTQWAEAAAQLLKEGHLKQAAFCFYVFQVRSIPHAKVAIDPSGLPALRASLNQVVGSPINSRIAQDPEEMFKIASLAIAYEATLDQEQLRPEHVQLNDWTQIVTTSRKDYKEGFLGSIGSKESRLKMIEGRKKNNLPVGPIVDGGLELRKEWLVVKP